MRLDPDRRDDEPINVLRRKIVDERIEKAHVAIVELVLTSWPKKHKKRVCLKGIKDE